MIRLANQVQSMLGISTRDGGRWKHNCAEMSRT